MENHNSKWNPEEEEPWGTRWSAVNEQVFFHLSPLPFSVLASVLYLNDIYIFKFFFQIFENLTLFLCNQCTKAEFFFFGGGWDLSNVRYMYILLSWDLHYIHSVWKFISKYLEVNIFICFIWVLTFSHILYMLLIWGNFK